MPPIQVIDRQPDPVAERISQAGNSIVDTIYKQQLFKLEQIKLQRQMKEEESEAKKAELQQQLSDIQMFEKVQPILAQVPENQKMSTLMRLFNGDKQRVIKFMDVGGRVLSYEDPQDELAKSKSTYLNKVNAMVDQSLDTQSSNSVDSQGAQRRNFMISQLGPEGPTFQNVDALEAVEKARTKASEEARLESQLGQIRPTYTSFIQTYQDAVSEIGGLKADALGALLEGTSKVLESNIGSLPNVQAYNKSLDSTALAIASFVNRGRPTDPDKNAILKILPRLTYPEATNKILIRNLNNLLTSPNGTSVNIIERDKKVLIDSLPDLVRIAKEKGLSPEETNQLIEKYYKRNGY